MFGASGKIGKHIANNLTSEKYDIRLFVSDRKKAEKMFGTGFEIFEGDLRLIADLQKGLVNIDGIFLNLSYGMFPNLEPENILEGLKNILVMARIQNLKQIIVQYPLVIDELPGDQKNWMRFLLIQNAIQLIQNSGLDYTILKTSLFMENFPERFQKGNIVDVPDKPEIFAYWLSALDLGKVAVRCFFNESVYKESIVVQGKERISLRLAAHQYVNGRKGLRLSGGGGNLLKLFSKFRLSENDDQNGFDFFGIYEEKFIPENRFDLLNHKFLSFQEFCQSGEGTDNKNNPGKTQREEHPNRVVL